CANELLLPPGEQLEARQESRRSPEKLANYWIQIAHNLSYGNRELRPITTLQLGLGDYLMAIERARVWHGQGRAAEAFQAYQDSTQCSINDYFLPFEPSAKSKPSNKLAPNTSNKPRWKPAALGWCWAGWGCWDIWLRCSGF
ncbi:MAG: hypothetical protein HC857_11145, partial [Synechococcales cyanobacterium RU_4_20]|nr:hypothetical protein [Synechococcales cyanobacterium RU_4_20]